MVSPKPWPCSPGPHLVRSGDSALPKVPWKAAFSTHAVLWGLAGGDGGRETWELSCVDRKDRLVEGRRRKRLEEVRAERTGFSFLEQVKSECET